MPPTTPDDRRWRTWFPFDVDDFLSSEAVADMPTEAVGAYTLLLCYAWKGDGLPNSLTLLAQRTRLPFARFRRLWDGYGDRPGLATCWPKADDGRLRNPRQEAERDRARRRSASAAASAATGWQSRSRTDANAEPTQCERNANASDSAPPTPPPPMRTQCERTADAERTQCASDAKPMQNAYETDAKPALPARDRARATHATNNITTQSTNDNETAATAATPDTPAAAAAAETPSLPQTTKPLDAPPTSPVAEDPDTGEPFVFRFADGDYPLTTTNLERLSGIYPRLNVLVQLRQLRARLIGRARPQRLQGAEPWEYILGAITRAASQMGYDNPAPTVKKAPDEASESSLQADPDPADPDAETSESPPVNPVRPGNPVTIILPPTPTDADEPPPHPTAQAAAALWDAMRARLVAMIPADSLDHITLKHLSITAWSLWGPSETPAQLVLVCRRGTVFDNLVERYTTFPALVALADPPRGEIDVILCDTPAWAATTLAASVPIPVSP